MGQVENDEEDKKTSTTFPVKQVKTLPTQANTYKCIPKYNGHFFRLSILMKLSCAFTHNMLKHMPFDAEVSALALSC